MIKNQNVIFISSIDWDFVWQGHQEIASTFAENDNRILFIDNTGVRVPRFKDLPRLKKRFLDWRKSTGGFREVRQNVFVCSPVILPFPYSRIARWINRKLLCGSIKRWMRAMEFHDPIIWTFLPTGIALDIIDDIEHKLLVYYCVADFYELVDNIKKVTKTEDEIIKKSDIIFAQGELLKKRCLRFNDNIYIYPAGVNMRPFEKFKQGRQQLPADIRDVKKPIIGYIGGIHRHIDFDLIKFIAQEHPEWSIVLVGPVQTDVSIIKGLKNVFLLGKKDFSDLPKYVSRFDVGIVPYNVSGYTETVFPTKLNEYHAMGKPVISTELPEVINFNIANDNLVLTANTYKNFSDCISKALFDVSDEKINSRIESAKKNSWPDRIEEMSSLLEATLHDKNTRLINWQERFTKVYRASRRKLFKATGIILSIYLLLFYTPLMWFIAEPLKISHNLKQADCIIVFAGGVGESGKSGQSYEERVQHAVELYNAGYADYMIFSSGYMYVFKEPLVMKALAVSLGVPGDAIILEDEAVNTYQNVEFTRAILNQKNWDKAIIVSSLYHMKRASLVFDKVAPNIEIIYSPVPNGRFYSHGAELARKRTLKQISWQQIKGIIHEYVAIIYYRWKGYL